MSSTARRLGLVAMVMSIMLVGMAGFTGAAAAQTETPSVCEDPTQVDQCEGGMDQYEDMLGNLYEVAHITLQYAGFVAVFAGAVLFFSARRSSDRAQTGVWLMGGGAGMIVLYFGFTALVSLLKWVAEGA